MSNPTPTAALKLCRDALRSILTTASKADADITAANALHATRQTENVAPAIATHDERAMFEEWYRHNKDESPAILARHGVGYKYPEPQGDWRLWQARAALDKAGDGVGCGKCPRDTPYGPATCGKCLEIEVSQASADARDAARYRAIRDVDFSDEPTHFKRGKAWAVWLQPGIQVPTMVSCRGAELDAAIDQAIAALQRKEG